MASGPVQVDAGAGTAALSGAPGRVWPSSASAYWALFVIVFATFVTFFDQVTFGMLAERIKHAFGLTDTQLGFLAGPASIICYVFVGIPLARLADIVPRKYVLAGSATIVGALISLGGMAQNYIQFIFSRVFLAAGGSAHAPASYSLLADAFPPRTLTRAFALLQFGFIGGTTLGPWIGGHLVLLTSHWQPTIVGGFRILGWQWILIGLGVPSVIAALLFMTISEPPRAVPAAGVPQPPRQASLGRRILTFMGWDAVKAINSRPKAYYPLFAALALSAVEFFGLQFWRVPFMIRTYGWNEKQIGKALSQINLAASLLGLVVGALFVEWLAKRYKDANVRAAAIFFSCLTVCSILSPMMPNGWAALIVQGVGVVFAIAGAVPQNAAVQRIAPNAMRGQVTAIYLFMFTFFGAMGSWFIGRVQDLFIGVDKELWKTLVITASTLLPLGTFFMYRAIRPYREEVERLEAMEKSST